MFNSLTNYPDQSSVLVLRHRLGMSLLGRKRQQLEGSALRRCPRPRPRLSSEYGGSSSVSKRCALAMLRAQEGGASS